MRQTARWPDPVCEIPGPWRAERSCPTKSCLGCVGRWPDPNHVERIDLASKKAVKKGGFSCSVDSAACGQLWWRPNRERPFRRPGTPHRDNVPLHSPIERSRYTESSWNAQLVIFGLRPRHPATLERKETMSVSSLSSESNVGPPTRQNKPISCLRAHPRVARGQRLCFSLSSDGRPRAQRNSRSFLDLVALVRIPTKPHHPSASPCTYNSTACFESTGRWKKWSRRETMSRRGLRGRCGWERVSGVIELM